ncbi:glutamine amidotransferase-related protein [Lichenibacterium dinghuense]|uniref:glutamine amidotransferase-related protein n=1 Tax=Lichenibacterium dinghuense TaxID=2895977 RepID=UPI001F200E03|nr:type 1 glutamine amidotransferase [Lichenibacterium sp. 6Y81]
MTTIGILETGVPPDDLAARFGRYDAMMRRMLGDGFACRTYRVRDGELPAAPDAHPAYVITGSSAGAYEDLPWIAPLEDFIRAIHGRARMVGVCFGHQVMAQALGGRVERSDKGWGLGLHRYAVDRAEPWMDGAAGVAVAASHQDQVVEAPPGATVLLSSGFTPNAALLYAGGEAVSFQFHPEFERGMAQALVDLRRPQLDEAEADRMRASLDAPSDAARVGGWIRRFIARP